MFCNGRWAQSIVAFEPSSSAAFEQYLAATRHSASRSRQQIGTLPALGAQAYGAAAVALRSDGAFGVQVEGEIQALALYSLCGTVSDKRIMRLLIDVARDYRRRGMGMALLMRCTTIARRAGLRYLVLEDVDASARRFACLASAELVFDNGECQAWIELGPALVSAARTEFADLGHT
jgi:GNAT superfamily N-acetyltransferase